MELEHFFRLSNELMMLQMLFAGAFLLPGAVGRMDLYRAFVRTAASWVVTFGPVALLLYVLFEVSRFS